MSLSRRHIFLGPHHFECLMTLDEVINHPAILKKLQKPKIDFQGIFFSTMIQCGVEDIYFVCDIDERFNLKSEFLSNRIIFDSDLTLKYHRILAKVNSLFNDFSQSEKLEKDQSHEMHNARMLLTDLLFEMKTNFGTVSIFNKQPYPDMTKLDLVLDSELYYPLTQLFSLIENDKLSLPIPTRSILPENVKKYEEIIDSDLFIKYSSSHYALQKNTIGKQTAINRIEKNAKRLQNKYSDLLNVQEFVIKTLDTIPIGAEILGGNIYGKIAEGVVKLIESIYQKQGMKDKRLTTYEFTPISYEILERRFFKK